MKLISTFIAILSLLMLLLAFNINIDLSNLVYYLGGKQADFNGIEGNFKTPFLVLLSITNIFLIVISFVIIHKKIIINAIYILINILLFISSFLISDYRVFKGYNFNPATDNSLTAATGTGYGYLFSSQSDTVMISAILSYITIFLFVKKKYRKNIGQPNAYK